MPSTNGGGMEIIMKINIRIFEIAHYYGIKSGVITDYLATKSEKHVNAFSIVDENLMSIIQEKFGKISDAFLSSFNEKQIIEVAQKFGIDCEEILEYLVTKDIRLSGVTQFTKVTPYIECLILDFIHDGTRNDLKTNNLSELPEHNNESFYFLKKDYGELYQLCSDVTKNIGVENALSMLKARQAIEFIVAHLGANTTDLFDNIHYLENNAIAPARIIELLHFIRKKANKSVHNDNDADTEGILDALTEICIWLVVEHDKKGFAIIDFTDEERHYLKQLL